MCGRYALAADPARLAEEFEVQEVTDEVLPPDYNVAPTRPVYVVVDRPEGSALTSVGTGEYERSGSADAGTQVRALMVARWGLVPTWAKDESGASRLINARSETVAEKPSFRAAFAKRRCLIPATGYYEWNVVDRPGDKPLKQPYYIHRADDASLAFAGLYEWWRTASGAWLLTCALITTDASVEVSAIHDRMPMTIEPRDWQEWLDPTAGPGEATALMVPAHDLASWPVSTRVNAVRDHGPDLLTPVPAPERGGLF